MKKGNNKKAGQHWDVIFPNGIRISATGTSCVCSEIHFRSSSVGLKDWRFNEPLAYLICPIMRVTFYHEPKKVTKDEWSTGGNWKEGTEKLKEELTSSSLISNCQVAKSRLRVKGRAEKHKNLVLIYHVRNTNTY